MAKNRANASNAGTGKAGLVGKIAGNIKSDSLAAIAMYKGKARGSTRSPIGKRH